MKKTVAMLALVGLLTSAVGSLAYAQVTDTTGETTRTEESVNTNESTAGTTESADTTSDTGSGSAMAEDVMMTTTSADVDESEEEDTRRAEKMRDRLVLMEKRFGKSLAMRKLTQERMEAFQKLKEEMAAYRFYGKGYVGIQSAIEAFDRDIEEENREEALLLKMDLLKKAVADMKEESRREKFEAGLIPFKDTDDHEWFASFVAFVKERGVVSGFRDKEGRDLGEFRPGNQVTIAEMLKMVLEATKKGAQEGEPAMANAEVHWARGYVKRAETLGMKIVAAMDNLDRPATRAEVIRSVLEAAGIVPPKATQETFADVSLVRDSDVIDFIEHARSLGLISGDDGKNTFRPAEGINRAEVAKIIKGLMELLEKDADDSTVAE